MSELIAGYREGLERGDLLIQRCEACGARIMYPRHRCPVCQSDRLGYEPASGLGTLHSYTVIRALPPRGFEDEVPYAVGVVKLDEGVQLLARLRPSDGTGDWDGYRCDQRVRFSPATADEVRRRPVAWFAPDGEEPSG